MTVQQIVLVAVAGIVGLYPVFVGLFRRAVSYQRAMLSLAVVRKRLLETGGVPEDAAKAIEVITHALVDTSDK